jgi:hypothetical protein
MTAFLWRAPIGKLKRVKSSLSARPAQAVSIALRPAPVRLLSVARDKISIESTRIGMCKTGWLKGKAVGRAGAKEHERPSHGRANRVSKPLRTRAIYFLRAGEPLRRYDINAFPAAPNEFPPRNPGLGIVWQRHDTPARRRKAPRLQPLDLVRRCDVEYAVAVAQYRSLPGRQPTLITRAAVTLIMSAVTCRH